MATKQHVPQNARKPKHDPSKSPSSSRSTFLCWPGMQNVLNFARFCVYLAIMSWAAIVLGLAVNFEKMLIASDLTRFVPLAIFIAATTMLVISGLLLAPVALRHNPVSTLYELVSLAFLGVFWLALGVYTATAEMGDVECFADDDETEPIEFEGFTTDIYHAQYRALEGFALINVFMLFGFLFFMLIQAFVQHRKGYKTVWSTPLPLYPWFGRRRTHRPSKLPPPVTSKEPKAVPAMTSKNVAPIAAKFTSAAKPAPAPAPAVPKPAASKPTVFRSQSIPARTAAPAASAPARAAPVRTQTAPAPAVAASAPRPKPTTTKSTPAVAKPTPYASAAAPAATKPKAYSSQYQRPAAGIPQTRQEGAATGQTSYLHYVPPKLPAPAQPVRTGQRATTAAAPAPAPPKRR